MLCSFIPGHAVRLLMGAMHSWGCSDCGRHQLRVRDQDDFWQEHPWTILEAPQVCDRHITHYTITQFNFVAFLISPANFQPCSSPKGPKSSSFCVIWWFHSTGISWSFGIGAFRRGLVPRILMSCACSHRPRVYFDVEEPPICFFFLIQLYVRC